MLAFLKYIVLGMAAVILIPIGIAILTVLAFFLYYAFMIMCCFIAGGILYAFGMLCRAM